jgi:AraC family ethanolamine operon transcriptional activator
MRFAGLVPSQHLQIFRYQDIDHFRQGLRGANVDFVPLAKVDIPIGQAVLSLPGCDVHLLHTFPRIVHTRLERNHAFVMLAMTDRLSAIFNGAEVGRSSLQFASGPTEYRAVEREPGDYAALVFTAAIGNRGWPDTGGEFLTVPISGELELRLRALIAQLFAAASRSPDPATTPWAGAGPTETLLETLDLVFERYLAVRSPGHARLHHHLRALKTVDDLIDSNSLGALYSAEIASRLGVSVRTLSNLMVSTNGMSLHRYIRLRRLWTARRQLLAGDPGIQVKQVALGNGFWHLGDFAAKYAAQFGELPSSTQMHRRAAY